MLARHCLSAQAWAESCGLRYAEVRNMNDWQDALPLMLDETSGPFLIEARVDAKLDAQWLQKILSN